MSPLLRRIAGGLGANAFGQAASIGMQLASLPLFLSHWDAATYGGWLILSALPSYLYMADAGMVTAAGNQMTMAMGRGDREHALDVLHSACAFMLGVCALVVAVAVPLALWFPWQGGLSADQRTALCILVLSVAMSLLFGLVDAVFRSTGRYAQGMTLATLMNIGAWAGTMVGLQVGGSYTAVALGALAVQVAAVVITGAMAVSGAHGLSWGVARASRRQVRELVKPALSFMAFPLANGLGFQGATLLVGYLLGPAAVAVFNTTRTLARIGVQVTGLFSHAVWPEFSRLYGLGGAATVASLYRRCAKGGALLAVAIPLAAFGLSPWILRVWTHGGIEFHFELMLTMMVYAAISGIGHVPRALLMSTNQHVDLAKWTVWTSALSLALGYVLTKGMGLSGMAAAMLIAESIITLQCVRLARRLVGGPFLQVAPVAS